MPEYTELKTFLTGETRFVLQGRKYLRIENYRKILHFDSTTIKLQGSEGIILIKGKNMRINRYDAYDLSVCGWMTEICFPEVTP